jgi:hypothetical protein
MKLQTINNTDISVKEYQGQRVVTFKDIDAVHGRPDGTARKRFNDNRERFVDGEDYFKICASEFRTHWNDIPAKATEDVTLITESGYLMLVKSFTDDLAWRVQRELVKGYFRAKEQARASTPAEQLLAQAQIMVEQERRLTALESGQKQIHSAMQTAFSELAAPSVDRNSWQDAMRNKIRQLCMEYELNFQTFTGQLYKELEESAHCNIDTRLNNLRKRMKQGGAKYAECQAVSKLAVISQDVKLCEIFTSIVQRKAASLAAAKIA